MISQFFQLESFGPEGLDESSDVQFRDVLVTELVKAGSGLGHRWPHFDSRCT